jgi:hypothetical protein
MLSAKHPDMYHAERDEADGVIIHNILAVLAGEQAGVYVWTRVAMDATLRFGGSGFVVPQCRVVRLTDGGLMQGHRFTRMVTW